MKIYMLLMQNRFGEIEMSIGEVNEGFTLVDYCKKFYPGWYLILYKDITKEIYNSKITLLSEGLK